MIDGQGTMALLSAMLDREPNPRGRKPPRKAPPAPVEAWPSDWKLTSRALRRLLDKPGQIARLVLQAAPVMVRTRLRSAKPSVVARRVPNTPFNGEITPARVFDARFYDLDEIKRMRSLAPGTTVNDVVLALTSGALRRYLQAKDALPEDTLVATVPISVRTEETANKVGGNELFVRMVPLCTHIEDPVERLRAIGEVMTSTKSYVNAVGAKTMLAVNTALPGALVGTIAQAAFAIARLRGRATVANTVVTNVPGMQQPLYLCGARVLKITGSAPPIGTIGLVNSIGSYCGELSFSMAGCRDLLPDPEFYMQCLDESFREYQRLARRARPASGSRRAKPARRADA